MPLNPITCDEDPNILDGTVDGDEILGLGGDDTIFRREGDDTIDGGAGGHDAGEGNDTIIYAYGTETLSSSACRVGGISEISPNNC